MLLIFGALNGPFEISDKFATYFSERGQGGSRPLTQGLFGRFPKKHPFLLREVVRQAKAHNHQFPTMLLHWLQIPKSENSQVKTVSIKEGYPASKDNVFGLEKIWTATCPHENFCHDFFKVRTSVCLLTNYAAEPAVRFFS